MSKQIDTELLEKVRLGGEEGRRALAVLYDRYHQYIQTQAREFIPNLPVDIEDFCSEVWSRTIKAIPTFRGDSLHALLGKVYRGGGSPHGIIGHYSVEFLRKKARQPDSIDIEIPGKDDKDKSTFIRDNLCELDQYHHNRPTLEDIEWRAERCAIVRDEIGKLPEPDIYLVYLTYWKGLTAEEIGELIGISKEMVWKRLSRVRDALKEPLAIRLHLNFKRPR